MPRRKDIWRCGIVRADQERLWQGLTGEEELIWFDEEPDFTFLADPFGLWQGEFLHIFAEHYDYRTRHGTIQQIIMDRDLRLVHRKASLQEPWHLSYPQIIEDQGMIWMLPEAHRSGGLRLYRSGGELGDWQPECKIQLDAVPVDASVVWRDGRWWMFYAPATNKFSKIAHLHVAWAEALTGPWTPHPLNPVRIDPRSSRPGGAPVVRGDAIVLPVQDCSETYGGAIRPLFIRRLNEQEFTADSGDALDLKQPLNGYDAGLHTINSCGDVTLFDSKRIDRSLRGLALDAKRILGATFRK